MKKYVLLVLALAFSITQAFACMDAPDRFEKIAKELNLSQEQRTKMKNIHEDTKHKLMPLREQLREIRHRINEAFKTNSMNHHKENMFVHEQKETIGEMLKIKMHERVEINQMLNEKQRHQLDEMMMQHKMKKDKHPKPH